LTYAIRIYSIGKNKESWLVEALQEYEKRLSGSIHISWIIAKNDEDLETRLQEEKVLIGLDPKGRTDTSEDFSKFLFKEMDSCGGKIALVIGGSDGLTPWMKQKAKWLISFSKLTFTHQITRLILLEQIYRALQIHKNTPYHK
jgi:23S rRNA (pseudouridine1915-N3)-methyltransferase